MKGIKMKKEIWKHIKNFKGIYEISSFGRVRRNWHGKYKYLKPGCSDGYHTVNLSKKGIQTSRKIHRLVLEAFKNVDFETLPKNFETHHKDENKSNNQPYNLIIVTKSHNQKLYYEERFKEWKIKTAKRLANERLATTEGRE